MMYIYGLMMLKDWLVYLWMYERTHARACCGSNRSTPAHEMKEWRHKLQL